MVGVGMREENMKSVWVVKVEYDSVRITELGVTKETPKQLSVTKIQDVTGTTYYWPSRLNISERAIYPTLREAVDAGKAEAQRLIKKKQEELALLDRQYAFLNEMEFDQ